MRETHTRQSALVGWRFSRARALENRAAHLFFGDDAHAHRARRSITIHKNTTHRQSPRSRRTDTHRARYHPLVPIHQKQPWSGPVSFRSRSDPRARAHRARTHLAATTRDANGVAVAIEDENVSAGMMVGRRTRGVK